MPIYPFFKIGTSGNLRSKRAATTNNRGIRKQWIRDTYDGVEFRRDEVTLDILAKICAQTHLVTTRIVVNSNGVLLP